MEWHLALALLLGCLVFFMALGIPVAIAFFGVNIVGALIFLGGEVGLEQLVRNSMVSLTSFTLVPIPLFLLMGEILFHTGVAVKAIDAVDQMVSRVPGRLSIIAVAGGTMFASLSGSTLANTAVLGKLMMPDMMKRGYHPSIAMGPIMATGGIAMLIPPSALAVLLGSLSGISISKLLIAGLVPGVLLSVLFVGYVIVRCTINPNLAPAYDVPDVSFQQKMRAFLLYVVPLLGIFFVVVGSILLGWATPTEAAALGCTTSLFAAIGYRCLSLKSLLTAVRETAIVSALILFIIVASVTFSQILAFSGATDGLLELVNGGGASKTVVLVTMLIILLLLGAFIDQVSMIMITLPFFIPLAKSVGIDPLWLAVLMLLAMEISLVTPPFGMILFVMKAIAPDYITIKDIYRAVTPFIVLELLVMALLVVAPGVALWLPQLVARG